MSSPSLSPRPFACIHALLLAVATLLLALPGAASAAVNLKVSFQPAAATAPPGYAKDTGAPFDADAGAGWVRADSLGAATHVPLDLTLNTRARGKVADLRQDSFIHMAFPTGSSALAGTPIPGAYEVLVPNGTYAVTVGVGDATAVNSVHRINIEGARVLADFAPTATTPFATASGTVTVTDGRLTVDSTGGTNTKLDYLMVVPAPTGAPVRKVNFQAETTVTPEGYVGDSGRPFDATRGYGWEAEATGEPLSMVGNGRERTTPGVDKRLATFVLMQARTGVSTPGRWELAAPNGTYRLTVAAGDPDYTDSRNVILAEGREVLDFTPTATQRNRTVTTTVVIADGRLTLAPTGGTNTKLDYVELEPVTTPQTPPSRVDFGAQASVPAPGYTSDYGQPYDGARGFGWEDAATGSPISLVGAGRERSTPAGGDRRLSTFMPMQPSGRAARWQLAVADGVYLLTVGVGDRDYTDSHHVVSAEGVQILDFTPTSAERTRTVTVPVRVAGGRLTLTPTGGTNTKITHVEVTPIDVTPPIGGALAISSPEDGLGLGSRMVFSTVAGEARAGHALTLRNTGNTSVQVQDVTFGGPRAADFELCAGQASGFALPAGATAPLCVQYRPQRSAAVDGVQVSQATLSIVSTAADSPQVVALGGLDAKGYEGDNEPDLQQIFDALGYRVDAGVTNKPFNLAVGPGSLPVGDEILSPYWTALDPDRPVRLLPVARYGSRLAGADSQAFGWYGKGTTDDNSLFAFPGGTATGDQNQGYGQNQLLLPGTTTGRTTFAPGRSFGIVDTTGTRSDDALTPGAFHNVRAYPAKAADGTTIPGTYLLADDYLSPVNTPYKNWDYQDFVFVMTNVAPDTTARQPAAGLLARTLSSFPGDVEGTVAGTGFTSVQGAYDATKIRTSSGRLAVTTSDDTNTARTNALQLGVNAGTNFRIQGRLVGPFTALDAGYEQQVLFFGPSGSNYLKAGVQWNREARRRELVVYLMRDGVGTTVRSLALPGGDARTIDLRIDVTPSPASAGDPAATVSYALDDASVFTALTGNVVLPPGWATANTPAGVSASHQGGGAPFTATYASFAVSRRY